MIYQSYFGIAQQLGAQQTQPTQTSQLQPFSLPHLYWHFLIYVSVLDKKADERAAQGQEGEWLRKDLQNRLQFSDADFAPIRASSQRLASQMTALNEQLHSLSSAPPSASKSAQIKALINQREATIENEIASLTQTFSPQKRAALEAFMTQFFAPKRSATQPPAATVNH
jgi:hypothetical protein